jgi:hypothetical protein
MKHVPQPALMPQLLSSVRQAFDLIHDHRNPKKISYSLTDALMSGLAVFSLKFPSLLKFDEQREEDHIRYNLKSLFGIENTPCDTQMRDILDPVDPQQLHQAYHGIIQYTKDSGILENYRFQGYYLVALDGTGYFSSSKIHCKECAIKTKRNGETMYYHQLLAGSVVHPEKAQVLPLVPEPILRHDGETKNDCELEASKRFLPRLREAHPELPIMILNDALYANAPYIKLLKKLDFSFILGVKEGDHKHLFDMVDACEENEQVYWVIIRDEEHNIERIYRFINNVELNKTNPIKVNFFEYTEKKDSEIVFYSTWITDVKITENNCVDLVRGARTRWKVENETFNTLKNQGYDLEHNYGHGKQHLSTVLALLMMLAFLIDQVQELGCELFQRGRKRFHSRTSLWDRTRTFFTGYFIDDWETHWNAIIFGHQASALRPKFEYYDTS